MGKGKENKVQAAITGALEVYCRSRSLQLFPPFANQQGGQMRRYCADLLGVLEEADLIALEVKELDIATGELHSFDQHQHEIAKAFERLGVPLAYAYNTVETLPYHQIPKPKNWDTQTLELVKRSTPTPLPGSKPTANSHQSLLEWLNGSHNSSGVELFGRVHGALSGVEDLRNGILVLLYSVPRATVAALQPADLLQAVKALNGRDSHLSHKQMALLQRLMGASANVFDRFERPPKPEDNAASSTHKTRPRI